MSKKKILIVEDTENLRKIVTFILEKEGYEVISADEGNAGLKLAMTESPDAILLDVMLPNITGFDICTKLKEDDRFKHIPVMMLTAIAKGTGKNDEYWRMKSRANDFLSKPFRAPVLLERVKKLLEGSTSETVGNDDSIKTT